MFTYKSGLVSWYEEQGAEMIVTGGYTIAGSLGDATDDTLICDASYRPQLTLDGGNVVSFLTDGLKLPRVPEGEEVIRHTIRFIPEDEGKDIEIENTFLITHLPDGRFFLILEAIDDLKSKDDVINWIADEMPDDMEITLLRGHTLIEVYGGVVESLPAPESMRYVIEDDRLFLNDEGLLLISGDNDEIGTLWSHILDQDSVSAIGLSQRPSS